MLLEFPTENGDNIAFGSSLYAVVKVNLFLLFKQRKPSAAAILLDILVWFGLLFL